MRRLRQQQSPEQTPATKACRNVRHAVEVAISDVHEVLDHPAASGQCHAQVEEEEHADVPQTALLESFLDQVAGRLVLRIRSVCSSRTRLVRRACRSAPQPDSIPESEQAHEHVDETQSGWNGIEKVPD